MTDRHGITRTAKEAMICKMSSASLSCEAPEIRRASLEEQRAIKKFIQNPLLNRMYHTRYLIVHKMVSSCLESFTINYNTTLHQNRRCQLLLLGAGIDISFEKLYSGSAKIFSVDLPEIISERKAGLSSIRTEEKLSDSTPVAVPGDLRSFSDAWDALLMNGFNTECPTIAVLECVLCYIDTPSVEKLLSHLSGHLCKKSVLIIYDPMAPEPSYSQSLNVIPKNNMFAQMMADKFEERKAPIIHSIETKEIQKEFVLSCKWEHALTLNMYQALHCFLTRKERGIPIFKEPFDEFAALALIHKLYGITFASLDSELFTNCLSNLVSAEITAENYKLHLSGCFNDKGKHHRSTDTETVDTVSLSDKTVRSSAHASIIEKDGKILVSEDIDDVSLSLLMSRILSLENRLHSLISRENRKEIGSWTGFRVYLREASDLDSTDVRDLFVKCFTVECEKFQAVKKYVKRALKGLKSLQTEYSKSSGCNFWVAEAEFSKLDAENGVSKNEKTIVGCIGLKAVKHFTKTEFNHTENKNKNKNEKNQNLNSTESRCEVSHMCVAPTHRKHGIARALLAALIHWAGGTLDPAPDIPEDLEHPAPGVSAVDPVVPPDLGSNLEPPIESRSKKEINNKVSDAEKKVMGSKKRFSSVDLTVLADLTAARTLYGSVGFEEQGPPVDIGGECLLQHMSLRI